MGQIIKYVYSIYGAVILVLLLGSYPYALIPPGLASNSYYLQLPSLFILSVCSLILIMYTRYKINKSTATCIIFYCIFIILNLLFKSNHLKEAVEFLGYFTIPFAFALYLQSKNKTIYIICIPATLLFSLLLLYGFINHLLGQEIIGITGNRNWMATALISLCPWAIYLMKRLLTGIVKNDRYSKILPVMIILPPTLFLVYHCHSRAAWFSLAMFIMLMTIYSIKKLITRIVFCLCIAGTCIVFTISNSNLFINAFLNDIRIPTWVSTVKLICDSPWTGTGAGNYVKNHTPYRAKSEYHRRGVATSLTTHPHNEFLNIAANLGIPAALLWLSMLFPLIMNQRKNQSIDRMSRFTAFMIFGHSMLDKTLIQSPTSIIALCTLGVLWVPYIRRESKQPALLTNSPGRCLTYSFTILLIITVTDSVIKQVRVGHSMRQAVIFKSTKDYDNAYESYKNVIEIDPENIKGHYGAGTLAVQKLLIPNTAVSHLLNAHAIDPDYAHLNRLLGKAYGTLNRHTQALHYFEKECRLFPADTAAFQNYFIALYKNGNIEALAAVIDYLNRLYKKNTGHKLSQSEGIKYTNQWIQAIRSSDIKTAIKCANKLTSPLPIRFVDPLFSQIEESSGFNPEFVYDTFNRHDFTYWREILIRRDLINNLKLNRINNDNEFSIVKRLIKFILTKRNITNGTTLKSIYPSEILQLNRIDIESFYFVLSWFGEELGVETFLYPSLRQPDNYSVYIKGRKDWYVIEFSDSGSDFDYVIKRTNGNELIFQDSGSSTRISLFLMPQSFLLKNQILAVNLNHYLEGNYLNFNKVPTMELIKISKFFHTHRGHVNISKIPIKYPFVYLSKQQTKLN